ncbi:MAG: MBL fold metallo-hydrolase [Acidobacteria bacterium]|nr:MBL fold metallo-hydrolase [Acidobacteriota bacterium]
MHIHHLNCATMCPYSSFLINGTKYATNNSPADPNKKLPFFTVLGITSGTEYGFFSPGEMICHCLLIETNEGLVLVDTGVGLKDIKDPKTRLGGLFTLLTRPKLDVEETAAHQVVKLGFKVDDVRHIVLTHLDLDHAGGLPDFPKAKVHVFEPEHKAAMNPPSLKEKNRYRPFHWEHNPAWVIHKQQEGERWFGFNKVQAIAGTDSEVLLIPVTGHTRGHCAVAVKTSNGWLLHCGDAYFFHGEMDPAGYHCTPGLWLFQHIVEMEAQERLSNQDRLRELVKTHSNEVQVFCAHDVVEFSRFGKQ